MKGELNKMAIRDKVETGAGYALHGARAIKNISSVAKRNSIMRMAAPGIFQYQYLGSDEIETDVQLAICQALQMTYASSVCTAFSLNPNMAMKRYKNISSFVQSFHKNSDMPTNLDGLLSSVGVESAIETDNDPEYTATIDEAYSPGVLKELALECWSNTEEALDVEPLNDLVQPYDRVMRIKEEKVKALQEANEAFRDRFDAIASTANAIDAAVDGRGGEQTGHVKGVKTNSYTQLQLDKNGQPIKDKNGNFKMTTKYINRDRTIKNEVVHINKLEAMEPTMVNVNIIQHGEDAGQFNNVITLGVKVMPRIIRSNVMIAVMSEMCKSTHHLINRILKFTKGEVNTLDFLLGWSASKKKALKENADMEMRFMNQQKKRKKLGRIAKITKEGIFPTLTVVITRYQADKVKELTGMDLTTLAAATKIMNEYYLLAFGVYDTDQNTLQMLFDGDSNWSITSIGAMKSMMTKTTDLLNQRQMINLFGRP